MVTINVHANLDFMEDKANFLCLSVPSLADFVLFFLMARFLYIDYIIYTQMNILIAT